VYKGLYRHRTPEAAPRKGDPDSFHYVRAGKDKLRVAGSQGALDAIPEDLQRQWGIRGPEGLDKAKLTPAMEAMLEMMPPARSYPHVEGKPQLIPQMEPMGGVPLEPSASAQTPTTVQESTPSKTSD